MNPGDLQWDSLYSSGDVTVHDRTAASEIVERSLGAEAVLTNKVPFRADTLAQLADLKYIGVLATGYDIVDTKAARGRGIDVTNIPTYGTNSVAQFAFALLLELCHHVGQHSQNVASGGWNRSLDWSYHLSPLVELHGKTLGLIGLGRIGGQTAAIGKAFGMNVIAHDPAPGNDDIRRVDLDELLRTSDVVSLHCPLTPQTKGLMNKERLALMKPSAFLLNTARGPLIVEDDLVDALNSGKLGGAGIDVIAQEPPPDVPRLASARNCLVTPHIAWGTKEARARLLETAAGNLKAWLSGSPVNVVNS